MGHDWTPGRVRSGAACERCRSCRAVRDPYGHLFEGRPYRELRRASFHPAVGWSRRHPALLDCDEEKARAVLES